MITTLADYHVHTNNSADCRIPMKEMCQCAVDIGVTEIAFTDHFNNHLLDNDLGFYKPDHFFEEIEVCRNTFPGLTIRAGVEVGEPHRWGSKILSVLERYPYDVVLGSLHWVGNNSMFDPNYFRSNSPQKAFGNYFTELAHMIRHGGFEILTHVDVPKRVGYSVYGGYNIADYEPLVREVWQACIDTGITPEINTKGLRGRVNQMHPTTEALKWYAEMGGKKLTLGSDAHDTHSIADRFDLAIESALEAGVTELCCYSNRQIVSTIALQK